ncbi:ATP-binding protein [Marivita sp. S2033]|uniref:ATP-binding protein n=1 Tax=Marivita sp. S2033 TaxID=3373187 RepID=UPI0039829DB3
MRRTRFDTRLIQILTAMAAMAIIVGVAAIAVNRYLVRSQNAMIQSTLPTAELASRIGASAEVAGTLATAFVQAGTSEDLDQITASLNAAVAEMERGARVLDGLTPEARSDGAMSQSSGIVARMAENGHALLELDERINEQRQNADRTGEALDALIEAATDLARLRITAGIAGIYADPETDLRPALDTLADRYFFAFERLSELGRMVDATRLQLQQVPRIDAPDDLARARAALAERLDLAARRVIYLPSPATRQEARALLDAEAAALEPGGLLALQGEKIALRESIAADSAALRDALSALSEQARRARDAAQARAIEQIDEAERRATLMSAALLALVVGAVGVGAVLWLYARRQLVARLSNVSRRIVSVAGADYGAPLRLSGHDEIGRMEKALNILRRRAIDAEMLRESLEDAVIARTGDVVAQMQDADAARAKAESADRSKTEFLARMSHEIRTPLNGIIGMLSLLETEVGNEDRRERVKTAHRSAQDLLEITNDILHFASGEDRANRGNPIHFALREFVGQLGHQLQSLAGAKGLDAVVDLVDPTPLVLFGDVVKIRQIIGNLMSNAAKYTQRGTVALSVDHAVDEATGDVVVSFTVSDTGVGMSQDTISHAFDAYSRTEDARRSGIEGLGLGLAISRTLTDALGGALSVESEPGLGSRFTLTVPLQQGDAALIEEADAPVASDSRCRDVLVIDDHAVNRMVARGYLERLGCRVFEAATGTAGLEMLNSRRLDLVLIDVDLPDMQGDEVAARSPAGPVLVALTAHLIDDTLENRDRLGVARILSKPISPRALHEVLALCGSDDGENEPAILHSLQSDIDDLGAAVTSQIVQEFLADMPAALSAITTSEPDAQRKAAHRLKGAASNFALDQFCAVLAQVEATPGALDRALIARVKQGADTAVAALQAATAQAGLQTEAGSTKR